MREEEEDVRGGGDRDELEADDEYIFNEGGEKGVREGKDG